MTTQVGHPIGRHSGLGLSAFYYTLLLVLAGFIGGNIINNGVDAGLGYADNEIGPWHTRRPTVPDQPHPDTAAEDAHDRRHPRAHHYACS